jgi:hypothetical protein
MSFLRDLRSDLVEKRLWPLALLLVAALVAVPLVLAKSPQARTGSAPAAPVAPTSPSSPIAGVPAVSVVTTPTSGAPLLGHAKDPFQQQHLAPKPKTASTGTTSPSGAGGTGSAPGGATPPKAKKVYVVASVNVLFGKAGGTLRKIDDVPRLTPLPSAADPVLIFLGVRGDLKTAVFMVSSDLHVHGAGRCTPSRSECDAIELKADDVALLDVTGANGKVTEYELALVKIALQRTASKAKAQAAYARASRAGARLLHRRAATSAVASALRYSPWAGILRSVPGTFVFRVNAAAANRHDVPRAVAGVRHEGWVSSIP